MKHITKTITLEYSQFEPGDIVKASSPRSGLYDCKEPGKTYVVESFVPPSIDCGELHGTVFVQGEKHGYNAEYIMLASRQISEDSAQTPA